jgi:hypothetical protein
MAINMSSNLNHLNQDAPFEDGTATNMLTFEQSIAARFTHLAGVSVAVYCPGTNMARRLFVDWHCTYWHN